MASGVLNKQVGNRIRQLRRTQRQSLDALAREVNITNQALSKIEKGVTDINMTRLFAIAEALDVPIVELFPADMTTNNESIIIMLFQRITDLEANISKLQQHIIELYKVLLKPA